MRKMCFFLLAIFSMAAQAQFQKPQLDDPVKELRKDLWFEKLNMAGGAIIAAGGVAAIIWGFKKSVEVNTYDFGLNSHQWADILVKGGIFVTLGGLGWTIESLHEAKDIRLQLRGQPVSIKPGTRGGATQMAVALTVRL